MGLLMNLPDESPAGRLLPRPDIEQPREKRGRRREERDASRDDCTHTRMGKLELSCSGG
jgi:hypothetical protein